MHRRLARGWSAARDRDERASPKIFTATVDKSILAEAADVESIEGKGGATLSTRGCVILPRKGKGAASKAYGRIPGALNIDSAEFYDSRAID